VATCEQLAHLMRRIAGIRRWAWYKCLGGRISSDGGVHRLNLRAGSREQMGSSIFWVGVAFVLIVPSVIPLPISCMAPPDRGVEGRNVFVVLTLTDGQA
jgi:hypothetical protein